MEKYTLFSRVCQAFFSNSEETIRRQMKEARGVCERKSFDGLVLSAHSKPPCSGTKGPIRVQEKKGNVKILTAFLYPSIPPIRVQKVFKMKKLPRKLLVVFD